MNKRKKKWKYKLDNRKKLKELKYPEEKIKEELQIDIWQPLFDEIPFPFNNPYQSAYPFI